MGFQAVLFAFEVNTCFDHEDRERHLATIFLSFAVIDDRDDLAEYLMAEHRADPRMKHGPKNISAIYSALDG